MIRNDVLQGDVGFVVGWGRKKGMGDLFTCPDLLVHSCCWEKLVGSKASPKLLVLSPIVSPTKGADGRSCCCSPDPTEPIFPTNSSHMQLCKNLQPPEKRRKKKPQTLSQHSLPPCVSSLSQRPISPKSIFSLISYSCKKLPFSTWWNKVLEWTQTPSLALWVCVCVCRRLCLCLNLSVSLSIFFCLFLKISPSFGKKLAVGWL